MNLQRRHFELIAEAINSISTNKDNPPDRDTLERITRAFSNRLVLTNPNFDRVRFIKACGVKL